jgi:hypothetical protein
VFPGLQGGPLMHVIAAKAVAFGEALQPEFKAYAAQVVANAKALAATLMKGLDIVSGGTDNHLMLVDLRPKKNAKGKRAEKALDRAFITCNKNGIPFDPEKPFVTSGIRLGTPAGTTRGFGEAEFRTLVQLRTIPRSAAGANAMAAGRGSPRLSGYNCARSPWSNQTARVRALTAARSINLSRSPAASAALRRSGSISSSPESSARSKPWAKAKCRPRRSAKW